MTKMIKNVFIKKYVLSIATIIKRKIVTNTVQTIHKDDVMETFSRDLIGGKEIEKTVLNIVKKTYPDAHTVDGYCKDWDIYIPSLKKGIEVKSDQYSQKSGNI